MNPNDERSGDDSAEGNGQHVVHVPVLLRETLDVLDLSDGLVVVDGTMGAAGHGVYITRAISPTGMYVGLDRDREILERAEAALGGAADDRTRVSLHSVLFSQMHQVLSNLGLNACDRVLLDIGVSSMQIDTPERGFSFQMDGPLDMRMQRGTGQTLEQWLARVSEQELSRVIHEYGEERYARRIAKSIVKARTRGGMRRTFDLVDAIGGAVPGGRGDRKIHPATRTFQALRIALNDELAELERGLVAGLKSLVAGGRMVVISFHSLEDRIVKRFMRDRMDLPFRKPVVATQTECRTNSRARSAKLRCGIKRQEAVA